MTVQPGLLLENAAEGLFRTIGAKPELGADIGTVAALITAVAPDIDTYVSDRLHHGEQIKQILARARAIMPASEAREVDAALAFKPTRAEDFSARNVNAYLDRLKIVLITVHAWLETATTAEAGDVQESIWTFLQEYTVHVSRRVPGLL